jgi:hypothetical protein
MTEPPPEGAPQEPTDSNAETDDIALHLELLAEAHGFGAGPTLQKARATEQAEARRKSAWSVGRVVFIMVLIAIVAEVAKSAGSANGIVLVAGLIGVCALTISWSNQGKV